MKLTLVFKVDKRMFVADNGVNGVDIPLTVSHKIVQIHYKLSVEMPENVSSIILFLCIQL